MKVEILEVKLSSDGFSGEIGDRLTILDEVGNKWVQAGWAKDLSGVQQLGERIILNETIQPNSVVINQEVETNG